MIKRIWQIKKLIWLILCIVLWTFALDNTTNIFFPPEYDTLIPPQVGNSYNDPVFGTSIKRISDAQNTGDSDTGGYLTWITDEYSTVSPFNQDNSYIILVHQSYFGLYDGAGTYLRDLPLEISASSEPRWSRKDNQTLYYHKDNMLKSYNISTGNISVIHIFSEYNQISGCGESDISFDGDHFVLVGNNEFVFVYQISTDTKFEVLDTDQNVINFGFDSVIITPSNSVIISWLPTGTGRFQGQELFDENMQFLRQVGRADGHKHLTLDTDGQEILIWTNSNDPSPIANCQNGIVKIRLSDSSETCLLQLDWSLAVHITAPDNVGYFYIETFAPSNPDSVVNWKLYTNELLKVDLFGNVYRIGDHRSRPFPGNTYNYQPRISCSRNGSRFVFNSNYGLQSISGYSPQYSDVYLVIMTLNVPRHILPRPIIPHPIRRF
jgi:hypothetical protein